MAAMSSAGRKVLRTKPSAPQSMPPFSSWADQRHGQDPRVRDELPEPADERRPGVHVGQARIDDDDVGMGGQGQVEGDARLAGPAHDEHAAADGEQPGQALADPLIRIDHQHTQGIGAVSRGRGPA